MMQAYAGPVQQGDMVVRANEVSPGITALLSKQNRKGAQGIYELPTAKPANPDYYNMALENVQNNLRSAAQTVNALAPEGERLAYINPQEEGILRLLGGSGEPEPVTGIPSFAGFRGFTGYKDSSKAVNQPTAVKANQPSRASMMVSPETGGRQTYYATDAASAEAVGKAREAAARQQAGQAFTTASEALAASSKKPEIQTMASLATEGAQKEKGFFEKLFENTLIGKAANFILKPIQDYNFNWYMENIDPEMGKKFEQLSEKEQQALKDNPYLVPGYQDYWDKRREEMMADQMKRDRGDSRPTPVKEEEVIDEETTTEEELPYFEWYRKFKQPMTYEDIIKRAYQGTTGPLLETFKEAKDRVTK